MVDWLDVSLWDVFKQPEEDEFKGPDLLSYFTGIERGSVRLSVAGKIRTAGDAERVIDTGADAVTIGRAAILHHDFPERCRRNSRFEPAELPVSEDYLREEGLSDAFIGYMRNWKGFVAD